MMKLWMFVVVLVGLVVVGGVRGEDEEEIVYEIVDVSDDGVFLIEEEDVQELQQELEEVVEQQLAEDLEDLEDSWAEFTEKEGPALDELTAEGRDDEIDEKFEEFLEEKISEREDREREEANEAERQEQEEEEELAELEQDLADALNAFIDEQEQQLFQEQQQQYQQQQQQLQQQQLSYSEMEQANDVAEALTILNAMMVSWFSEPLVPEQRGNSLIVVEIEKTSAKDDDDEEFDEEICYKMPLELQVECFTAVIQMLREQNDDLCSKQQQPPPVEYHHHYHHHHTYLFVFVAILAVLVGFVIGRCCRKGRKRWCKKMNKKYQAVPQQEQEVVKMQEVCEEREFYPYYTTAKV